MRVQVVACGPPQLASARFRAWSLVDAWNDPRVTCHAYHPAIWPQLDAEVVVIQKLYPRHDTGRFLELADQVDLLRVRGTHVVWDLCDPVWYWMNDAEFQDLAAGFSAIVVSSGGLQWNLEEAHGIKPVVIEDRMPSQERQKQHAPCEAPTLVWFGYYENRAPSFSTCALTLERLLANRIPFRVKIIDNAPEVRLSAKSALSERTRHTDWQLETFQQELLEADIALLPSYPGLWGELKSANKHLTAAWAGLPVSDGQDYADLKKLILNVNYRKQEGQVLRQWAETYGHISQSVNEWKLLLERITHPVTEEVA